MISRVRSPQRSHAKREAIAAAVQQLVHGGHAKPVWAPKHDVFGIGISAVNYDQAFDTILASPARASRRSSRIDTSFMSEVTHRLERMARGRQIIADAARDRAFDAKTICVVDLDDPMHSPPAVSAVSHGWHHLVETGDCFAISATSHPFYYDLLAFDDGRASFSDLNTRIVRAQKAANPLAYYRLFHDVIYPAQRALSSKSEISCVSAFNGFCMYNALAYHSGSSYVADDFGLCEHVSFNRSVSASTKKLMIIDPEISVAMPPEHGPQSLPRFIRQKAGRAISRLLDVVGYLPIRRSDELGINE